MEEVIGELTPQPARGSVQAWLREQTADAHDAAERAVMRVLMPIEAARYRAYLQSVLALYEALEAPLWRACGVLVPDSAQRIKAPWLREDLAALGGASRGFARADAPSFTDPMEALGAAYVIEGSTLGGPVLLARLRAAGLLLKRGDGGARFLVGYGTKNAAMWQAFRASLERATSEPRDRALLRRGALAMFDAYRAAITHEGAR